MKQIFCIVCTSHNGSNVVLDVSLMLNKDGLNKERVEVKSKGLQGGHGNLFFKLFIIEVYKYMSTFELKGIL